MNRVLSGVDHLAAHVVAEIEHLHQHLPNPPLFQRAARALVYRGTSLIRNRHPVGPYSRTMPRLLWWSWGGWRFLMSEVPL